MHGIVLAHGKANAITNLHKITWDRYFDSYEILSPEDDPAFLTNVKTTTRGLSEHNGNHTIERQRYAFELASKHPVAAVIEYDVILLDRLPIPNDMELLASEKYDNGEVFATNWYAHCPWVVTAKTAETIALYVDRYLETRYSDRWLAAVCDDANIIHRTIPGSYSPHGGTVNSMQEVRLLKYALRGRQKRLICIHGNKLVKVSKEIISNSVL
jgi:hypothetical protein